MSLPAPVIVVPGITATYLRDEYPIPPEYVWRVLSFQKDYERVALHPNNLRYEAIQPSRITPDQVYQVAYKELIEELRYNLREKEDKPVPVYAFSYDWRMRLEDIEKQLGDFVEEVIDRTKLLKHYHGDGYAKNPRVNLVGHSMGGLLIAGYIESKNGDAPVSKVATLATPYRGSFEPVIKVTTGTADLGVTAPSSREREAARITPSLYHLIPSFRNGLETDTGIPSSMFKKEAWQPSIIQSIQEWVRLKALPGKGNRKLAVQIFDGLLSDAARHRKRIENFRLEDAGMTPGSWLAVAGVDAVTRVRMKIIKKGRYPQFVLTSRDRMNKWDPKCYSDRERMFTGDGTVPLEGALPGFLDPQSIVCITQNDYGYWEIGDRILNRVGGFHGILPNMNMLHRLIVRFFTDSPDRRGNTWGRPIPGVSKDEWNPPLSLKIEN